MGDNRKQIEFCLQVGATWSLRDSLITNDDKEMAAKALCLVVNVVSEAPNGVMVRRADAARFDGIGEKP